MINLNNQQYNASLSVSASLMERLKVIAKKNTPKECGGILVGKYSDDKNSLHVDLSLEPLIQKNGKTFFERSLDGLNSKLSKLFDKDSLHYVGEWHTHPNGTSKFSQTDLKTMQSIGNDKDTGINNPILLIISVDKQSKIADYTFYLFKNGELTPYE